MPEAPCPQRGDPPREEALAALPALAVVVVAYTSSRAKFPTHLRRHLKSQASCQGHWHRRQLLTEVLERAWAKAAARAHIVGSIVIWIRITHPK